MIKRSLSYLISGADAGRTIEEFLRTRGYSHRLIVHLRNTPLGLTIKGETAYTTHILKEKELLCVTLIEEESSEHIIPSPLPLSIIYEDEDILHCLVPRLTIQPLVENAVVHGLEPRRGLGSVMVRLWEEDSSVCVRVEDDGVGFDPAEVDLEKAQEAGRHNHIALPNILRRLNLLYGDQASLTIRSHPGSGTQIMLALPIDKEM